MQKLTRKKIFIQMVRCPKERGQKMDIIKSYLQSQAVCMGKCKIFALHLVKCSIFEYALHACVIVKV